ncbi:hypothetical protein NBRC111894_1692 [Sporolactobacillus inulinus]|uniref:Uncharacterized protein n=1 Tax=Sporolactobacillus inulinus TaxID=2078 RepID=A0A4Y1ZBT3_9BACL|nr:hypothetical protein NBRC111894_1692 [Sporolactobacillus inulinus]
MPSLHHLTFPSNEITYNLNTNRNGCQYHFQMLRLKRLRRD